MSEEQTELEMEGVKSETVEKYKFEPIKGYPMLNWHGKRPFTSTQYYPAQKKEVYGEEVDGWINKVFWGDNLQVMSHLLKEYRGKVQLVYIDPPFDSKADYKKKIQLRDKSVTNDQSSFEDKQYTDIWSNDDYLQFMYERLTLIRELLTSNGGIWLHCDWRKCHQLRLILDEIFGTSCFRGHIVWRTMTSSGYKGKSSLGKSSADLLYYSKSPENFTYNPVYLPMSENMRQRYSHSDSDGRLFKDSYLGDVTDTTIEQLKKENKLYITSNGGYRIKHYLDEAKGTIADNIWTDIPPENSQSSIMTGYPTQKPEALLSRIIEMTSCKGDVVFDCFMGSGTTQAIAMKLGRKFLGADINLGAIQTTTKRLNKIAKDLNQTEDNEQYYTSFEVYNVNHYDVFRNPVEAKDLLIDALEIDKLDQSIYDGKKDGYNVKIMPVNRIATREDLNELLSNFPIKVFEKLREKAPNKPVDSIMLVCMGHEPDLKAHLEQESGYKLDVKVVDILRDKANIEFKRDSEAKISTENNKLIVENFYPMNLLQKLSLQKESVSEWRELVETIMIDWNFDGAVMEPTVIDTPDKNEFVKGEYDIPAEAGTIKIKITDLLSESYEEVINYG
jgi:site-specific DNA-methyltransferase (adenine-specific)/adenine-specific DNA-methyltransferase